MMSRFDDMENRELQVIKTVGEDGEEVTLKLLDIVTVNDFDYALLLPADENLEEERMRSYSDALKTRHFRICL